MKYLNLFTLLFVGLKLSGLLDWSWWVVLSPSILSVTLALAYVAIVVWVIHAEGL